MLAQYIYQYQNNDKDSNKRGLYVARKMYIIKYALHVVVHWKEEKTSKVQKKVSEIKNTGMEEWIKEENVWMKIRK